MGQTLLPWVLRYLKYHGQGRRDFDNRLNQQDIILTTYGTVMAERRRGNSPLHQIDWYRLVLDEAHTIRNWSSKQFTAVHSISSQRRWCLTGTPIQNSLDDLGSLVKFLNMPLFSEPAIFRKYVTKIRCHEGSTKADFQNLRLILSAICLRRNKVILPGQEHETENRRPSFTPEERTQYRSIELACKRALEVGSKGYGNEKTHHMVMEALLRLRMFCNNGLDDPNRARAAVLSSPSRPDEILSFLQQSGEAICAHCSVDVLSIGSPSDPDAGSLTPCWRVICGECTQQHRSEPGNEKAYICSFCREKHSIGTDPEDDQALRLSGERQYPSKVRELVEDVQAHYLQDKW
ncbi:unnamed protein product [Clonostachys byssicola]|uniref:Helicase ATP-binding domain-containing protein n=1 Tax=Clonostachys byssicola TaxID=160290 RepID=A0A9N9U486_9HYPO|nr:unnamed protein product [Clonostachys byssicola]